jgi:branched-chain amino acid transport system ATP-binding protein
LVTLPGWGLEHFMILELESINGFYGLSHILRDVSLNVAAGEIVSILGRNGAGKTTTIQAVMGLVEVQSGAIRVAGTSIVGFPPHEICRLGIGWVPQGRRIFADLTVEENIRLAALKVDRQQRRVGLDRVYAQFPILRERSRVRAIGLSGGEQQMLAIARALVGNPHILLLDEPTEGLSPIMVRRIVKMISEIAENGVAVLLAEQNVRMALSAAARHYILDKGEVRVEATTKDIMNREDLLARYLGVSRQVAAE